MSKFSFGKEYRLRTAVDFEHLRSGCLQEQTRFLKAYFKRGKLQTCETRIGISVSKKVGKANIRNRCKRQIREIFRASELKNKGIDVLFVVSPRVTKDLANIKETKVALNKSFYGLLRKIGRAIS